MAREHAVIFVLPEKVRLLIGIIIIKGNNVRIHPHKNTGIIRGREQKKQDVYRQNIVQLIYTPAYSGRLQECTCNRFLKPEVRINRLFHNPRFFIRAIIPVERNLKSLIRSAG